MAGRECYHCKQWIEQGEAHDCWTTTEAALTRDLPEDLRDAWGRFRETAAGFGEQRIYASHNSIMFSRRSCYFFVRPKKTFLEVCVFLGRTLRAPQVRRVDQASKSKTAHTIRITHRDEIEPPFTEWLHEAVRVERCSRRPSGQETSGCLTHLDKTPLHIALPASVLPVVELDADPIPFLFQHLDARPRRERTEWNARRVGQEEHRCRRGDHPRREAVRRWGRRPRSLDRWSAWSWRPVSSGSAESEPQRDGSWNPPSESSSRTLEAPPPPARSGCSDTGRPRPPRAGQRLALPYRPGRCTRAR